ncbi:DUF308 domain-containing protein [Paraburkholderia sp. Tr-20389]|uniref:DUF308 domain-containing protein n=1 Tax=Paraburkholderia sp. Tr-20389 TaxID=2703903 RepID=UPI001981E5D8|nr:DUF308 domain-containing protein [Paraburkholderia sp. Tr-20389]MBN3751743.1 DUF308 domain-containing protein [Paraburkholderia sp. Tr-20389]
MADRDAGITRAQEESWLTRYYVTRAAFSAVWVALAFSVGQRFPAGAVVLLIVYPAWDALANYIDASRSGGLTENRTQALNVVISLVTTVAVIAALRLNWVLGIFGIWAVLSGLLQFGTAVRRWKHLGAQWAMILSGGQSALAGAFFLLQARAPLQLATGRVAGYAAVGAVYFLVSAAWLLVGQMRSKTVRTS